ncbi:putative membrane protein YesL [Arthrobacter sp. UYP6]|uniref:YesL family protein n=1 Tax=Arthrobacter sp. UYP6 TaxID=1756378 RepID=UPI003397E6A2
MKKGSLAARAYDFFDTLTWIALLNLAFIGFTVLGGIVFGFGPSFVAGSALVRRRASGEAFNVFPAFWRHWKSDFVRANVALLPAAVVLASLLSSWEFFRSGQDGFSSLLAPVVLVVAGICATIVTVFVPILNHYDIRTVAAVPAAITLTLTNPLLLILNGLILSGVTVATIQLPGLVPFFSFGLAIYLTTRVALDFFVRNEARLAASPA